MADLATRTHRRLLAVVAVVLVATAAGMVLLWPRADALPAADEPLEDLVTAEILAVEIVVGEPDPVLGTSGDLALVTVEILDGPDAGEVVVLEVPPEGYPEFGEGDRVALDRAQLPDEEFAYFITDFQRLPALGLLVGLFVVAVLLIGRWHGLRSLIGLALSLLIVVRFVVPAILAGESPPLVALVGALAVMIVTLYITHGVNEMTTSAVVGTAGALTLTVAIGVFFVGRGKVTGFASDEAVLARFAVEGLDLQGLVLAGLIIAALGVLDDVTISQSSTVFAIHDTDRRLPWSTLFARAMKVGRDHIAAVVNTLFLAYAGASLALLVLFSTGGLPVMEIINSEILAEEIIKIVVGSLGLIAAVPMTTALAATVAVRRPPDAPPVGGGHAHPHGPPPGSPRARQRPIPAPHPVEELDESDLDDDDRAYRSWVRYLREGPEGPATGPPAAGGDTTRDDPDGGPDDGPEGSGGSAPTSA